MLTGWNHSGLTRAAARYARYARNKMKLVDSDKTP